MDESHEGGQCLFAAQGDATKALEPVEEAFDLMVLLVEPPVDRRLLGAGGIGLDLGGRAEVFCNEGADSLAGQIGRQGRASAGADVRIADTGPANVTTDKLSSTNNILSNNLALLRHLKTICEVIDNLKSVYDYVLVDSHPEISDVLRSIIYASDYYVSPVKLDLQSSVGVPTVIAEIGTVNNDVALMKATIDKTLSYNPMVFAGATGMMAREYGGTPKQTEADKIRRLRRADTVFAEYVTEGGGIRRSAQDRLPVYDIGGANAAKQSSQFKFLTSEFLTKCP